MIYTATSSGNTVQDDYTVTYVKGCYSNSFTLDNPSATDLEYIVNSVGATSSVSALYTTDSTDSVCPSTCTVEIFDEYTA